MKAYAIKTTSKRIVLSTISYRAKYTKKKYLDMSPKLTWKEFYKLGYRCVPVSITEIKEVEYTLQDIIDAVQYGFDCRDISQNNGKNVPNGNVLQWLMSKKNLMHVPEEFEKYKVTEIKPNEK